MTVTAVHRHDTEQAVACKRVAFFYDDEGAPIDRIEAGRVTMPDGHKPMTGELMACGSCGALIGVAAIDLLPGEWDVKVRT